MDEMDIFLDDDSLLDDLIEVDPEEDAAEEEEVVLNEDKNKQDNDKEEDGLIEVIEDDDDDIETKDKPLPDKLTDKSNKSKSSNTNISSFVDALKGEGVLHLSEGQEINSPEDLYDAIQDEKERYLQEQLDSFPENSYREALEAVKAGVPIDQVLGRQANIEKYGSVDEDELSADDAKGESIRKQILIDSFVSKGFTPAKASKYAKRSFDSGEDVEDAKEAIEELRQGEKTALDQMKAQAKEQSIKQETNRINAIKEFESNIKEVKEIIPGKRLTAARRKELYDGMTKGVEVVNGKSVDILNKFLIDGGNDARLFLSEVILTTNYGKKKDALSTRKARSEATKILTKQLQSSASSGFADEGGLSGDSDLWDNALLD